MSLRELATQAARAGAKLRGNLAIRPNEGACPFDVADRLGVVVRLLAAPSLEGMYSSTPEPTIVLSTERPAGRRRYTCAHELGHHVFGHGMRLDQIGDETTEDWSPDEFLANRFAAALLMPKVAVESAFARRGWSIASATAESIFCIAQELGVGYVTLVRHLDRTLGLITSPAAESLRKIALSRIRARLAGFDVAHDLVVVDKHWNTRPIDIEIGDVILAPRPTAVNATCVAAEEHPVPHFKGVASGSGTITFGPNAAPLLVRVSRRGFEGLARYRHLEEAADE